MTHGHILMDKGILVVGGSGFIGKGIQEAAMDMGMGDLLTFTYWEHPEKINEGFKKIKADLLQKDGAAPLKDYDVAIFTAGHASHRLADADPARDIQLNELTFINFMRHYRGSVILLSSQSVYQGLAGEVKETVDHVPESPFGMSKRMAEAYADFFYRTEHISKLWVFRLLYAYGKGELERRLLPMCAWASSNHGKVTINGGGKSYMNPLHSSFVGEVLLRAVETIEDQEDGSREVFNLNHPKKMTALDVARLLSEARKFQYSVEEGGENWPVRYWGDTGKLATLMKEWKIHFPDEKQSLLDYFTDIQTKPITRRLRERKQRRADIIWPV